MPLNFVQALAVVCLALYAWPSRCEWIEPKSRPWRIQTTLTVPYADLSLHNDHPPDGTLSGQNQVTYRLTPSLVPSVSFGWRIFSVGASTKLFNNTGRLVDKYGASDFSSLRFSLNLKYFIMDFTLQKIRGLHTDTSAGNSYRPDLQYLTAGYNIYGGFSFSGDIPYSIQAYYGSVEVPSGVEMDLVGFTNFNWNSMKADSSIIPPEKAAAFADVANLNGFATLTFDAGLGLGLTLPLGDSWLVSSIAAIGLSCTGGTHVFVSNNDYSFDFGNEYFGRLALVYRNENHTVRFQGYFDRWTQSIRGVDMRNDFKGGSVSYAYRF